MKKKNQTNSSVFTSTQKIVEMNYQTICTEMILLYTYTQEPAEVIGRINHRKKQNKRNYFDILEKLRGKSFCV